MKNNTDQKTNIQELVISIIEGHPDVAGHEVNLNSNLRADFGIDSLVIAEISIELEDTFNVKFDPHVMAETKTVADLIRFVKLSLPA